MQRSVHDAMSSRGTQVSVLAAISWTWQGTIEHDAQPVLDATMDQAPPRIDPARFHEPSYRSTIRQLAVGQVIPPERN